MPYFSRRRKVISGYDSHWCNQTRSSFCTNPTLGNLIALNESKHQKKNRKKGYVGHRSMREKKQLKILMRNIKRFVETEPANLKHCFNLPRSNIPSVTKIHPHHLWQCLGLTWLKGFWIKYKPNEDFILYCTIQPILCGTMGRVKSLVLVHLSLGTFGYQTMEEVWD